MQASPLENRIRKNHSLLGPWAKRNRFDSFRIYDRDIPEYPFVIEVHGKHLIVWDRRSDKLDSDKNHQVDHLNRGLQNVFGSQFEIVLKERRRHDHKSSQYEVLSKKNREFEVREGDHRFLINPYDYLDTGLFLDHRFLRAWVRDELKKQHSPKFLNLFSYTGSFSVYAARAGAQVTSVDLSEKYLEWSQRNFALNQILTSQHHFESSDVLKWLRYHSTQPGRFYGVVCDPPTFSNSKNLREDFDVERDHPELIRLCMKLLVPGGFLVFSTNKRKFHFDQEVMAQYQAQDLTEETESKDFHDRGGRSVAVFRKPGN